MLRRVWRINEGRGSSSRVFLLSLIAVVLSCILAVPPVFANTASFLGLTSRASAMGGALTALADDYTATYYNPACLAWSIGDGTWLQAGISAIYTSRSFEARDNSGRAMQEDNDIKGLACGLTMDLNRLGGLKDWSFGLAAYVPTQGILDIDIPESARTYFFPIYNDVGKAMNLYAGVARRIGERVSLGVGANVLLRLLDTDTHIVLFVDANELLGNPDLIQSLIDQMEISLADAATVKATANRELVLNAGLHAGIAVEVFDWLKLGLSFRDKLGADSSGYQYLYIKPVDEQGNVVEDLADRLPVIQVAVSHYSFFNPREYTLGVGVTQGRLKMGLDLSYAQWSGYRGPHQERPPELFKDTWNPRIGIEYALTERIFVRAGYVWRPSPVPAQTGETNYLDADTQIFCSGFAYRVGRGSIDAHVQYHRMEEESVHKNGGLPEVEYGGSLWNAGLTYMVRY